MNPYETLLDHADQQGIKTKELPLQSSNGRIKGNRIAIREDASYPEKHFAMAEELEHYYTTGGNILEQDTAEAIKAERKARIWAYNNRIGLIGIIKCYESGCQNIYEMAQLLELTEESVIDALEYYHSRYGTCTEIDNYTIYFERCKWHGQSSQRLRLTTILSILSHI